MTKEIMPFYYDASEVVHLMVSGGGRITAIRRGQVLEPLRNHGGKQWEVHVRHARIHSSSTGRVAVTASAPTFVCCCCCCCCILSGSHLSRYKKSSQRHLQPR